jgi:hypothetical protein
MDDNLHRQQRQGLQARVVRLFPNPSLQVATTAAEKRTTRRH